MSKIDVRPGTPAQIFSNWLQLMAERRKAQSLKPLVTIVPTDTMAHWLKTSTVLINVQIVTFTEWVHSRLPASMILWPDDAGSVLQSAMPALIRAQLPANVPGLYLTVIQHALECRRANISQEILGDDSPLLAQILKWLDESIFTGRVFDDVRLYQYAARAPMVLTRPDESIIFFGFSNWDPGQWTLVNTLAHHKDFLVYWLQDNHTTRIMPMDLMGARLTKLGAVGAVPEQIEIQIPYEHLAPDAASRLIAERVLEGVRPRDILVVGRDGEAIERLWVSMQRLQIPLASEQPGRRELTEIWRALLRGPQSPMTWQRLQDLYPQDVSWLDEWSKSQPSIKNWSQAREFVVRAGDRLGLDPVLVATAAKRFDVFETVTTGFLEHSVLHQELWNLPSRHHWPWAATDGVWVVSARHGVGLCGREVIVLPHSFDRPPAEPALDDLLGAVLRHRMQRLRESTQNTDVAMWGVDRMYQIGSRAGRDWATLPTAPDVKASESVAQWYLHWYGDTPFGPQGGRLGENLGRVMPRQISASDMERFGACPLAFFFSRGLGLSAREKDPWTSLPSLMGQWAHLALHYLSQNPRLSVEEAVERAMKEMAMPQALPALVARQIRYRLGANLRYVMEVLAERAEVPASVESERNLNWNPKGDWDVKMRLDRVEHYRRYDVIVDFKTGRLDRPEQIGPDHLQIPLYILAWQDHAADLQREVLGVVWGVTERNQFRRHGLIGTAELAHKTRKVVDGILDRMEKGEFYPVPDPTLHPCRVCDFRLICPSSVTQLARRKYQHHGDFMTLWLDTKGASDD